MDDSGNIFEFEFSNSTNETKYIWVEPVAYSIEIDPNSQYKFTTLEKSFAIEFTSDSQFTLWMDSDYRFKLFKRSLPTKLAIEEWSLDIDFF